MTIRRTSAPPRCHAEAAALVAAVFLSVVPLCGCADMAARARIEALRRPPITRVLVDNTKEPAMPAPTIEPLDDPSKLVPPGAPPPLCTEGNRIVGPDGQPVRLRGVNIASLEWRDEGENVLRSLEVAINDWGCNVIRVPLSQDRWFGRAPTQTDGGAGYQAIVDAMVLGTAQRGAYILVDLHWSNAGAWGEYINQHCMPDSGSLLFWRVLGQRYANHPAVLMGLYNEPHDVSWDVWLNGGIVEEKPRSQAKHDPTQPLKRIRTMVRYRAVGHQELYDTVRAAAASRNLIVAGGLDWGYDLAGPLQGHAIQGENIVYDSHVYSGKDWKPELSWDNAFITPSQRLPVLIGEWGGSVAMDEQREFLLKFVQCLRNNEHLSWTAWCFHPQAGPPLLRNWDYEPNETGQMVMRELKGDAERPGESWQSRVPPAERTP